MIGKNKAFEIEFVNLDEFVKNMDFLRPSVIAEMEKELKYASTNIQKDSKEHCPYKTGRLRSSIHVFFKRIGFLNYEAGAQTDVEYAVPVEKGTHNRGGRPYMMPALHREFPEFMVRLKRILNKAMS